MYNSGATTFPVCPTCQSLGTNPASTAALEAPTAAPNLSANFSNNWKLSPFFMPRPPLMTMDADDKSGRSDFDTDSPTHEAFSKGVTSSTVSTWTETGSSGACSKDVGRTDKSLTASCALTLTKTLPAYIGLTNVSNMCVCV